LDSPEAEEYYSWEQPGVVDEIPATDPIEWDAEEFMASEFEAVGITSDDSPTVGDNSDGNEG
jgi:hypothetical protein